MEALQENFRFDLQKFKDVVHYAIEYASQNIGTEAMGNTKLHKCLYYADILTFLDTMRPLTGADYHRQKFGPTARQLALALRQLAEEAQVRVDSVNYFGYSKKEYVLIAASNAERLSNRERDLIAHVIRFVCEKSAVEIGEFSHDEVWASVPVGARIPYFSAFAMFPAVYSEDDLKDAQQEILEVAPLIEAQRGESRTLRVG